MRGTLCSATPGPFALFYQPDSSHIRPMAKNPDNPKKPGKTPKSKAHRPDVQPIGPALAELLNPAINRGESGIGSSSGLQPPPDNSRDRRSGGEAAAHRARASTRGTSDDVAKRDASVGGAAEAPPVGYPPPTRGEGAERQAGSSDSQSDATKNPYGFEEAPQANYGTSATIPTLDPGLAQE